MARRRKICRASNNTKFDYEETDVKKFISVRKIGSNNGNGQHIHCFHRNSVIFRTVRSYSSIYNSSLDLDISDRRSFSSPTLTNLNENNCINLRTQSASTQSTNEEYDTCLFKNTQDFSTQTEEWLKNHQECENIDFIRIRSPGNICQTMRKFLEVYERDKMGSANKTTTQRDEETKETLLKEDKPRTISPSKIPIRIKPQRNTKLTLANRMVRNKIKPRTRIICAKKKPRQLCVKLRRADNIFGVVMNEKGDMDFSSFDKIICSMKKYTMMTIEWSFRMVQLFNNLGAGLKKSLICLYKVCEAQSSQFFAPNCKCSKYQEDIDRIDSKMIQIEAKLDVVNRKLNEYSTNNIELEALSQKMDVLTKSIETFGGFKSELEALKKKIYEKVCPPRPFSPPPPPPPPPLPPAYVPINSRSNKLLSVIRNDINFGNNRPLITLEDILKVKLKKISVSD